MDKIKKELEEIAGYPPCANLSPRKISSILSQMIQLPHLVNLGDFKKSEEAENAAAELAVCSDESVNIILYRITSTNHVAVIFQVVSGDTCSQTLMLNGIHYYRGIFFTSSERKAIRQVGGWDA